MQGKILGYDEQSGEGHAVGDDGKRYAFRRDALKAWPGAMVPTSGDTVDFKVADGERADDVYFVRSALEEAVANYRPGWASQIFWGGIALLALAGLARWMWKL